MLKRPMASEHDTNTNISEPRDSDNDDYPDNFDACPLDPDCH
jgi:hypothetical protein